jgi:hypothetical protein
MKRQFLFLFLAAGLLLIAAPSARAITVPVPGFCGKNYAMLMTGDEPSVTPATGSGNVTGPGGFPGALTAIVGVGVIQFSRTCAISGELIYNDGDLQFTANGGVGFFAGPAGCYKTKSILNGIGLPCFDGGNHFSGGSVSTAGQPPGMALVQFTANFNLFNLVVGTPAGSLPFAFTLHETSDDSIVVGNTVPSPTAPVLTLTMEEQSPSLIPVPTRFGLNPYVGNSAITCSGYGADDDDIIADIANSQSGGVAGAYGTAIGSVNIANGHANGILSFNTNDNLQVAGSSAPPSNNTACAFSEVLDPFDGPASFQDGTSNIFSTITSPASDPTCTNAANPGAGFTTSQVAWGTFDTNSYATVTGLTETSFPFIPPGEMSECTHLIDTPSFAF